MKKDDVVKSEYWKGERILFPTNQLVGHFQFKDGEEDEVRLCHCMAVIAEKNGMNTNHLHQLFPAVLRMLKSEIGWSK